ncbi:MAG: hypothetical protein KGN34_09260 [Sphingomonadales bacterium]|nr:hypothetical protein [Sphingomonadales bacterium]
MIHNSIAAGELASDIGLNLPQVKRPSRSRLAGWFSTAVSLALLVMVVLQFRDLEFGRIAAMVPRSLPFWAVFAAYYACEPLSEWWIYRRLWKLPFTGIAALLRKRVSNELLLGYLGEVQFYAWARSRLAMDTAPFGAIKDVTILSALTGNIATLAMLAAAWPLVASGQLGMESRPVFLSLGVVLVTSFVILLFRQKLFSLPRRDLGFVTAMHFGRIFLLVGLAARMWHLVLPDVGYGLWLVLATLRMLVSRLPLIPNKDVVFAGLAVFLLGHDAQVGDLMAMMAGIMLAAHLITGGVFAMLELAGARRL